MAPLRFPRILLPSFSPCSLERTRPRDDLRPKQSAEPFVRLAPAVFLASTPERSVSFGTPCLSPAAQNGSHNRPKSGASGERPVFRPGPLRDHVPLRTPYPVPVSCSGSVSHSAPPQLWRPGPRTKRRAKGVAPLPAAGKARMRGAQGVEPESPPLPGEPDAVSNRPLFSGVCLVRRNAQRAKPNP